MSRRFWTGEIQHFMLCGDSDSLSNNHVDTDSRVRAPAKNNAGVTVPQCTMPSSFSPANMNTNAVFWLGDGRTIFSGQPGSTGFFPAPRGTQLSPVLPHLPLAGTL
jgi:hypothetical protein